MARQLICFFIPLSFMVLKPNHGLLSLGSPFTLRKKQLTAINIYITYFQQVIYQHARNMYVNPCFHLNI